jgi:hypothetical protein
MASMTAFNERSTRSIAAFFLFCFGRTSLRSSSTCSLNMLDSNSITEFLFEASSGPWLSFRRFMAGADMMGQNAEQSLAPAALSSARGIVRLLIQINRSAASSLFGKMKAVTGFIRHLLWAPLWS